MRPLPMLSSSRNRLLLAILSGAMLCMVVGLQPLWPIAWIAPIPLLLAVIRASSWREARLLGFLSGAIGQSVLMPYYTSVVGVFGAVVIAALQALAWMAVTQWTRRFCGDSTRWWTVLVYPVLWAALDCIVTTFSPHSSFGSLAYSQSDFLPLIQITSISGLPGIIFIFSLFASVVAISLDRKLDQTAVAYGVSATIIAGVLLFGTWRLNQDSGSASIQAGMAAVDDFIDPPVPSSLATKTWSAIEASITELSKQGAKLVLLPEKIANLGPADFKARTEWLKETARANRVYLVAGLGDKDSSQNYNRALLISPDGEVLSNYRKHHLVPGLERAFAQGVEWNTYQIERHRYGLAICKDMHFPSFGRAYGKLAVDAMLVPAWDFHRDAWMTARMTALRGVENGYSIIRSSREGLLSVSDAYGRFIAEKPSKPLPGETLLAPAPIGFVGPTLYTTWGDWFGWSCALCCVLLRFRKRVVSR